MAKTTKIFISDLTHTVLGISALSFPLGAGYVASYGQAQLGDSYDFELFKFPDDLEKALREQRPVVAGFSCFSWNFELSYALAERAKQEIEGLVVVFGGPNFPILAAEQEAFLRERPAIDIFIQNEGEQGLVDLVRALETKDFDFEKIRTEKTAISNGCYLTDDGIVTNGPVRITDISVIPSPYLNGMMDKFFSAPLAPMMETTRGCPFSCAFCADGLASKNKVIRYGDDRTEDELNYIANRIQNIDELIITDLNFGMYKQDIPTAEAIARTQKSRGWPLLVKASAGKNKPDRVIEAAKILDGSWVLGSAVQSTDSDVLSNIKRSNISVDAFRSFIDFVNGSGDSTESYTEIILALPGDSKERHFASLRSGIESDVSTVRMYQAMLLLGTDMASQATRERHGLDTRFRIIPGCIGAYKFGDEEFRVAEIEEITVGGNNLSFDDYVACRVMNLLVEAYVNNGLFEEIFTLLKRFGIATFDVLEHIHAHLDDVPETIENILESYRFQTVSDLYETREQAKRQCLADDGFSKFMNGELGTNELLSHRALLYLEFDLLSDILRNAAQTLLDRKGVMNEALDDYLTELVEFIKLRKARVHEQHDEMSAKFGFDFSIDAIREFDPSSATKRHDFSYRFYHTPEQQKQIRNAVALYANHPGGIGRMIQRSNLKMMFRHVDRA